MAKKKQQAKAKPKKGTGTGIGAGKNATWRANHLKVLQAYEKLLLELKRRPILDEVAAECGLSVQTVWVHIQRDAIIPQDHEFRVLTDSVLMHLYLVIKERGQGAVAAARLWLQYFEGFRPTASDAPQQEGRQSIIILPVNQRGLQVAGGGVEEVDWEQVNREAKKLAGGTK